MNSVLAVRQARSSDPSHEFYRLQSERWLESLVVKDITRIDPALSPDHVSLRFQHLLGPTGEWLTFSGSHATADWP